MGSKRRRVYDAPQTPLERVVGCAQAKKEQVAELKHSGSLWIELRIPRKMHNAACETALEAGTASPVTVSWLRDAARFAGDLGFCVTCSEPKEIQFRGKRRSAICCSASSSPNREGLCGAGGQCLSRRALSIQSFPIRYRPTRSPESPTECSSPSRSDERS